MPAFIALGQQHFRHEQDAVAKILADDAHAFDKRFGQYLVGRPAALEQDLRAFLDFFLQPVIEVVVHLLHQLVVGKFGKDDLVVGHLYPAPGGIATVSQGTKYCVQYLTCGDVYP
jgi:hypothetical protein